SSLSSFFSHYPSPSHIYTLSLHDALPISFKSTGNDPEFNKSAICFASSIPFSPLNPPEISTLSELIGLSTEAADTYFGSFLFIRSEEHTSELQSRFDLVCRLLLEKKKKYR